MIEPAEIGTGETKREQATLPRRTILLEQHETKQFEGKQFDEKQFEDKQSRSKQRIQKVLNCTCLQPAKEEA